MHLHLAPFTFSSSYIFYHPICVMYIDHSWYYYVYQCLGLVLWSTEVLTEGLPLLFGITFSIVIFLELLFSWCGHFLLINTWMDGWMDGWMNGWMDGWMDGWMECVVAICFSVRLFCLCDRQRGICLYFSEGGLMCCRCPSVCLFVCLSCVGDRQRGICLFSAKAA